MTQIEKAILAGGCFWGLEDLIRKLPGVVGTRVGYTGGEMADPKYKHVKTGKTGHTEAIEIEFNADQVSYRQILELFFQIHDPTTTNRQGNDIGSQYRSAIFYLNADQERTARDVIGDVEASGKWPGPVVTEVVPAKPFYEAEPEHQDYLERYPHGYTCHFVRPDWKLPDKVDA